MRKCTVCEHPKRVEIERALIGADSLRALAKRYALSFSSIQRHQAKHLPSSMLAAEEAKSTVRSINIMAELQRCAERVNLLFDACDRWLRDADDPSRYDIGPRAEDVKVTYMEPTPNGLVRRKRRLSELLPQIERGGRVVTLMETKHADPRELVLKASARLETQLELVARLIGELKNETTINVHLSPEWVQLRTSILQTLEPFPDARLALARVLSPVASRVQH